jgi:imidazolonepropionase-like amidohydrolase
LLAFASALAAASPRGAGAEALALRGATLHTVSGPPIERGVLVVEGGRIAAIGPEGEVAIPAGAQVRELAGKVVIPGLVDTHSHIGVYARPLVPQHADGNELTKPLSPEVRALDALWPADPGIRMALAGGVTTANVMPGSGNVVGGQTAYVKLRGARVDDMLLRFPDGSPMGGMKMANGENPKRFWGGQGKAPMTRMAVAFLERKLFVEAQDYRKKHKGSDAPERNLGLEAMLEVLDGRRIVHHHTHRADDVATVLRIAEEFGHRVVIHHGTEAHLLAAELAARRIPVSTLVVESPGGKPEAVLLDYENPARLEAAGVKVALHTDDMVTSSRLLLRTAGLAARGGMSEAGALAAVTRNAAEMLDLGERLGTLERGKDADFVVLSGPPLSVRTRVLETWIDGVRVWDAADPRDLRYQTGGFEAAERYPRLEAEAP